MSIYTVGHSDHTTESFFKLLRDNGVTTLVDVRSIPASGRFPHFCKDVLEKDTRDRDIEYIWMGKELGGRGEGGMNVWGHLEKQEGKDAMLALEKLALERRGSCAMMCSEGAWRSCHRGVISNFLVTDHNTEVKHIDSRGGVEPHEAVLNPDPGVKTLAALPPAAVTSKPPEPTEKTVKLKEKKKNRLQR
eukprot:TRINITY_DN33501_c0_g1_i1.p1 TRINITY_DN33501_c0_g1~~TRINITY_DN33501_c0_g1_i1.p1  ORF type:complete len:190 (+),score=42.33 TRINITY_DN33501_c0_g1_i1:57-626(+)